METILEPHRIFSRSSKYLVARAFPVSELSTRVGGPTAATTSSGTLLLETLLEHRIFSRSSKCLAAHASARVGIFFPCRRTFSHVHVVIILLRSRRVSSATTGAAHLGLRSCVCPPIGYVPWADKTTTPELREARSILAGIDPLFAHVQILGYRLVSSDIMTLYVSLAGYY